MNDATALGKAAALGRRAGRALIDALLPPTCFACRAILGEPASLCAACWAALDFLGAPLCHLCGYPLPYAAGGETLCAACAAGPPDYDRGRAALAYDEASRALILPFKHRDALEAAPLFARWMAQAGAELLAEADLLLPVPLHWRRLFARRYNQAALLGQALARLSGRPLATGLLLRRRATPSQGRLSRNQRAENVAGAFALSKDAKAALAGRSVLLLDDVVTTGATVSACARALKRGGARRVLVLALARVVRPHSLG